MHPRPDPSVTRPRKSVNKWSAKASPLNSASPGFLGLQQVSQPFDIVLQKQLQPLTDV